MFVAFYAAIGALGAFIDRRVLNMVGGALLVFLGLQVAGVINVRALWRDTRAMPTMGGGLVMAGGSGGTAAAPAAASAARSVAAWPGIGASPARRATGLPALIPVRPAVRGGLEPVHRPDPRRDPRPGHRQRRASLQGTVLLVAYAAGLAVPFLAVALGASWVSRRLTWVGRHHHAVSLVTGLLLVALGVLMLTNMLGRLATLGSPLGL